MNLRAIMTLISIDFLPAKFSATHLYVPVSDLWVFSILNVLPFTINRGSLGKGLPSPSSQVTLLIAGSDFLGGSHRMVTGAPTLPRISSTGENFPISERENHTNI